MTKILPLLAILVELICWIQAQYNRRDQHRNRPPFSLQSFGSIPGFLGESSQSSHLPSAELAAQFNSGSGSGFPEFQEQPQRGNEISNLPLYKQSYPGLYVKGHASENFKYEPTRQVEHHHGPNFQFPRNIAQSSRNQQGFAENTFSEFN